MTANRTALRRRLALSTALCVAALAAAPVTAAPIVTPAGTANPVNDLTIAVSGSTTTVTANTNSIINWNSFNVASNEIVNFKHASSSGPNISILNRVTGGTFSDIQGAINSDKNVAVYIVNPNGIVFGNTARVNVGSLVASNLDVTDADFFGNDGQLHFSGTSDTTIFIGANAVINTGLGGTLGDAVFISGGALTAAGSVSAEGDLGLIVAKDVRVTKTPGSPLTYSMQRGSLVPGTALQIGGSLTAKNIAIAMLSALPNTSTWIFNTASLNATGVAATDYGIELLAGNDMSVPRHMAVGDTTGLQQVNLSIFSQSKVISPKDISIYGNGNFTVADLVASGNISISSTSLRDINASNLKAGGALSLLGGTVNLNGASSTRGGITLRADKSVFLFGNVDAFQTIDILGSDVTLGFSNLPALLKGALIKIRSTSGDIKASNGTSLFSNAGAITLNSAANIDFDTSAAISAGVGIYYYDLNLETGAQGNIKLGTVSAGKLVGIGHGDGFAGTVEIGDVNIIGAEAGILDIESSQNIVIGKAKATNAIKISSGLDLVIDSATITNSGGSAHDINLSAARALYATGNISTASGSILLDSQMIQAKGLSAYGDVTVKARNGNASAGSISAGGAANISASNVALTGDLTAASIFLDGQNVTAQKLTSKTGNILVQAYNGDANIKGIDAKGSAAINTDGTGNVTVIGNVKTGGDFGIGAKGAVSIGGLATIGNNFGVTAAGSFAGGEVMAGGAASVSSAANVTLNGDMTAGTIFLDGQNVTAKKLTSTTGKAELRAWNGNAATQSITATGGATISADGQGNPSLGNLTITGDVKTGGDFGISASGTTRVEGSVDVTGGSAILKSYVLNILGDLTSSGSVALTGGFNSIGGGILAGGDISALGNTFSAKSVQSLNGGISLTVRESIAAESLTAATDIKAVVANGPGSISGVRIGNATAGGNVSLASSEDIRINGSIIAGGDVDINASLGLYMENGTSIAANQTDGNIKIFSRYGGQLGALSAHDISLSTAVGGETTLRGNITATTLDLDGGTVNQDGASITVDKLTGRNLSAVDLRGDNRIKEIGDLSVSGNSYITDVGDGLIVSGIVSANGSYLGISTNGDLTLAAGSSVSGREVGLGTRQHFINHAGANAVSATAFWRIFSTTPEGNVYGGLDSGNTAVWGWQNNDAATGSRYVFSYQPTLTFTSTDYAKTYGDDIVALLAGRYTVSGLHQGIQGAFLGDTLADVISGSPLLTSLGATARASVAGGPYVIEIGQGSLTSLRGYKFAFNNAGRVTVGKKALTATVVANDKAYDGTTQATGSFTSLNGLVQGDVVEVGGKLTFASKNAGTQKVTVENLSLAGADAGNYTVTISVPDQLSATIFKKAVSVQVAVDDKTYDGTKNATGKVTSIDGKIAGDDLTATGGSYSFGDKNAGTDKLVTISNIVIGGKDAGNYEVTIPASVLADILKKAVTVNVSVDNKTYDQTTAATGRINGINGIIAGDDVKATGGSYAFADKNAGKGKAVNVSGIQLSGNDLGNYEVTIPATVLAEILKRAVNISIAVDNKTYDGTTDATGRITGMDGIIAGDQLTVTGGKFAFLDKNAGAGKAATATGFTYGGADAGNYEAVVVPGAMADIAKRAITVRANDVTGYIFSPSTNLTYTVTQGSVAPGDAFTGALAREPGYVPGDYAIGLGTLSLSSNYDMTFEGGIFTLALGTPPSRDQVPNLYRSFELGGRAAVFGNGGRTLTWAQAFDCQASTQLADQCR